MGALSVTAALALSGGLLAACGSSHPSTSASSNNNSSSTTAAPSAPASKAVSLTIALPVAEPVQSPVYLASKLGYFKKNGINAKVIVLPADTAVNAALIAGSVQYTSVNAVSLIAANEKNVPLQFICTEYDGPEWALAVSQSVINAKHITPGMNLKQLFLDLKGQKIAIVGTAAAASGLMINGLLKQEGLPTSTVTLVGVSASSDLGSAFSHGEVAGVFDTQPIPDQLITQTKGQVVFDTTQISSLANVPWEGILGTRSYIASHTSEDKAVCKAIGEADNYLRSNPSGSVTALQSTFPSLPSSLLKDAITSYKWANNATMSATQWTNAVKTLSSIGMIKQVPSPALLQKAYSTAYLP